MTGATAMMEQRPRAGRKILIGLSALGAVAIPVGVYLAMTGHPLAALIGVKALLVSLGFLMFGAAAAVWLLRLIEADGLEQNRSTRSPGQYHTTANRRQW